MWPSSRVSSSTTKCARISQFSVLSTCDNHMEFVHWAENRSAVTETRVVDPAGGRSPKSQRASFFHVGRSSNITFKPQASLVRCRRLATPSSQRPSSHGPEDQAAHSTRLEKFSKKVTSVKSLPPAPPQTEDLI